MLDALAQTRNRETNTLRQMQPRTESRIEQSQKSTARRDSVPQSTYSRPRERKPTSYAILMRRFFNEKLRGEDLSGDLTDFIEKEKERLNRLKVPAEKTRKYLDRLFEMNLALERGDIRKFTEQIREVKIPKNPAKFGFGNKDKIRIKSISINNVKFGKGEKSAKNSKPKKPPLKKKLRSALETLFGIPSANAQQTNYLPVIEDIQSNPEVQINYEIKELARSLENNPVKIFNFVRNSIAYEPYFGAKKGSVGCLREQVCNDTDASSLVISLLRASGIPAKYKTSLIIKSVEEWKNLLGVDETKTVYAALSLNKMPVYTLTDANQGKGLNDADFSIETHLAVEWTFAEVFYEYDERGGNISNHLDLNQYKTTEELQNALSIYTKKQWIPIDVIVRQYNHDKKPILADSANFNAENFFYDFLKYQGDKNPIEKYTEDIESATGLKLQDNLSTKTYSKKNFDILPASLPYSLSEGIDENGNEIVEQTFSVLPDKYRYKVKISLLKALDESPVLEKTFFASEINNKELTLTYTGATDADNAIIESYGGIHATPSELVSIKAILRGEYESFEGASPFSIGDSLILRFAYSLNGEELYKDEKFSVAGNNEGIYVSLSKVQIDPSLDTDSNILLRGNVGLARKYLERVESESQVLKQSLDYDYQISFSRAVVTQNRVLGMVDGMPMTFDFKGLTLDASAYINDYSNSGDYKNHQKDFRLLWGQFASYYEGQLFTDITGLEAISTVKGLQYAYSKPAEYTIHTITSANESLIDSLALSENTKINMHADIQNGNTIITPDKFVGQGVWNGILYISLKPDWTATYAIGEQSQTNGGDSITEMDSKPVLVASSGDILSDVIIFSAKVYKAKQDGSLMKELTEFIFEDKPQSVKSIMCTLSDEKIQEILDKPDWDSKYGYPCAYENIYFGQFNHKYILTTNAAKFYSPEKYEYWKTDPEIIFDLKEELYSNGLPQNQCTNPMKWEDGFCWIAGTSYDPNLLKSYWGTYVYEIVYKESPNAKGEIVGFAIYNPDKQKIYELGGLMYEKYVSSEKIQDKYVPNLLGFPESDKKETLMSPEGGTGYYQQFTNGNMFLVEDMYLGVFTANKTFIIYGAWNDAHKQLGWVSGIGLPESDVGYSTTYENVVQKFEKKICYDGNFVTCEDKTVSNSLEYGFEAIFDTFYILKVAYSLYKNNIILNDYYKFIQGIDAAADTFDNQQYYCILYNAENIYALPPYTTNYQSYWIQQCAMFPQNIAYYKSKKNDVQNKIIVFEGINQQEQQLAEALHDAIVIHVENSILDNTEWLGYFSADIATLIILPAAKIGVSVVKNIAIKLTERYSAELILSKLNRVVLVKQLEKTVNKELLSLGTNYAEEALEKRTEVALFKALKDAGIGTIRRFGTVGKINQVKYDIEVIIDIVQKLPDTWVVTSETFDDVVDTFAYHYQKHVLDELPKAGKPIVSQQQYFDDAVKFWEPNKSKAVQWDFANGMTGWKIKENPGGIYTDNGEVVSFWYVPTNP